MKLSSKTKNIIYFSMLGIFTLVICYFVYINSRNVPDDDESEKRMNSLKKVLISIFGNNWKYIMVTMAVLLTIAVVALYLYSRKSSGVKMGDKFANTMTLSFIALIVIFTIFVVVSMIKTIRYKELDSNYVPDIRYERTTNIIIAVSVSVILFSVFLYIFLKLRRR